MSRRARSAASRMRAREARTSVSCASVISCSRTACSASRRAVMSKIAPSSHQRPSPASLREAALEHPADGAVAVHEPVLERERPAGGDRLHDALGDVLAVVGMLEACERAHRVVDEVARGVADDLLDLVAQPLHRPVAVAQAAVDGARDAVDERAQHRLARPQARGAQAGRHAQGEHLGLERHAHDVIGAGVQRGAKLVGRLEVDEHDHVDVGHLGQRAGGLDQHRPLPGVGEHDLGTAAVDQRDRLGRLGHAQQLEAGIREDAEGRPGEVVQPEQEHPVAVIDQPGQGAHRAPLESIATASRPPHRRPGLRHDHWGPYTLRGRAIHTRRRRA